MILTCPSCGTRYNADRARFRAPGMNVRCAKCGHLWFHALDAEAEAAAPAPVAAPPEPEPAAAPEPTPVPEPGPDVARAAEPPSGPKPEPEPEPKRAPEPAAEVKDPAAAHPSFEHALVPEKDFEPIIPPPTAEVAYVGARPSRGAVALRTAGWFALVLVVIGLSWATIAYRQPIAEAWPRSSSFYRAIGMPVNIMGLAFQDVDYDQTFEDGQPVLSVTGKVVNASSRELPVPQVRVSLSDLNKRELQAWNVDIGTPTLGPGESRAFVTRLLNPPSDSRTVDVRFVQPGETP
jgi:predicted Zn finger-like uncharacterized protein